MEDFQMTRKPTYEELAQRVKELEKEVAKSARVKNELQQERTIFLGGPVVVFKWLPIDNWPAEYVSPNVTQFGYQADDFISGRTHYIDIIHPEDSERVVSEVREHIESGDSFYEQEYRIIQANGEVKWVYDFTIVRRNDKGEIMHYDGYILDNTDRKQAEEALRQSERQLNIRNRIAEIFLTIPDDEMYGEVLQVVLEAMESPYGTFAYIDENGDRIVPSMTRDIWDECKMRDKGIFFPRDKWSDTLWARCLIEKKSFSSNGPFKIPDGHMPIGRALATPIVHQGESIGNLMVGDKPTDYTEKDKELLEAIADRIAPILYARLLNERHEKERKRANEAVRESKENLDKAQKLAHIGSWSRDLKTDQGHWSDEAYRIFGLTPGSPEHPTHEYFLSRVHADDRNHIESMIKRAVEETGSFEYEFRTVPINGSERIIHSRGEVECDDAGLPVRRFGTNQDITQTRRLEDQLQKAQKMEAMGLMAGGIAHDLNNILSGIVSYPELILMDLPEDSPFRNPIKVMQDSGMRAADVVADLMTIARGATSSKEVLDLNSTVREYLDSAEHKKLESTHSFVTFKTQFDSDLLNVNGSRTHIKKTLMNLVANASEAIEGDVLGNFRDSP